MLGVGLALFFSGAAAARAQGLSQDEIDLTGRANPVQGAGARALGMGGAFLARADDATAASWNPAGLSYLRHPEVTVVSNHTGIVANRSTEDSQFSSNTVDFAALTYPLGQGSVTGAAQISYQRVIPFNGTRSVVRETQNIPNIDATGGFDVIALGTGLQLSHRLRVGATLNRWFDGYQQTLTRNPVVGERLRQLELNLDFHGWNANFGVIYSPVEEVNLAAVVKTSFTGDIRLARMRTDTYAQGVTANSHVSNDVRLDFPAAVGFGASWRPRSALTISADYTRAYWSGAYIYNYFVLAPTPPPPSPPVPPQPVTYARLPWPLLTDAQNDTEQIRGGVEYVLLGAKFKVPLRIGYFSDQQLVGAATGSAPRFNSWTAGTGLIVGPVLFDLAYLYQSGAFSDVNGRNTIKTQRFVASMIYRYRGLP